MASVLHLKPIWDVKGKNGHSIAAAQNWHWARNQSLPFGFIDHLKENELSWEIAANNKSFLMPIQLLIQRASFCPTASTAICYKNTWNLDPFSEHIGKNWSSTIADGDTTVYITTNKNRTVSSNAVLYSDQSKAIGQVCLSFDITCK